MAERVKKLVVNTINDPFIVFIIDNELSYAIAAIFRQVF